MATSAKVRRSPKKSARKRGSYLPYPEQVAILCAYAQGGPENTMVKLAAKFHRDKDTISAVVDSDLGKQLLEAAAQASKNFLRDEILPIAGPVLKKGLLNKKLGPQLAFDLLDRFQVIPPKMTQQQVAALHAWNNKKDESPDVRVARVVGAMTQVIMETRSAYGQSQVTEDEVFAPLRKRTVSLSLEKE